MQLSLGWEVSPGPGEGGPDKGALGTVTIRGSDSWAGVISLNLKHYNCPCAASQARAGERQVPGC